MRIISCFFGWAISHIASSQVLPSPRKPLGTIRIFSSTLNFRRVTRLMSRTNFYASTLVACFGFLAAPFRVTMSPKYRLGNPPLFVQLGLTRNSGILPTVPGILINRCIKAHRKATAKPYVKLSNHGVLVLLTYSNASLALQKALSHPDYDFLVIIRLIVVALCLTAFGSWYLLARLFRTDRKDRISLMFGLGLNSNGAGLVPASTALSHHPQVMLPLIFLYSRSAPLAASVVRARVQQASREGHTRGKTLKLKTAYGQCVAAHQQFHTTNSRRDPFL